ncbi:MAG TPA: type II toxin-antitoxin system RelE/ParE family toxin [Pyrinomonadaceae bacterium]
MTYDFHPDARVEYREAAVFYEARQSGLGAAFTLEVEAAIDRIVAAPERWRAIEQDVRRCLTHTFPYGILYTIEEDSILIVAVMHLRRRPGYWRNRLSGDRD